jgi:glycosyltransferase involved in cell wall biosynthesis
VQPSIYESFGIPVVEALALGVPTVVSKGAGVAEFLNNDVDSLLVEPGDAHALRTAIERLLHDDVLYERIAHNGRATAMRFLPLEIAKEYLSLFDQVRRAEI